MRNGLLPGRYAGGHGKRLPQHRGELQVGDLVWAWHEATGDLALKPVVQTLRRESDALVALRLGSDTVQATPEHPFWVSGQGWESGRRAGGGRRAVALRRASDARGAGSSTRPSKAPRSTMWRWPTGTPTSSAGWMFIVHNATICLTQIKKLLASEGKSCEIQRIDLRKVKKGDNVTPHHLPSDAYMKKHGIARQRWSFNKHGAA